MNVDQIANNLVWILNQTNFKWPSGIKEAILGRALLGVEADSFFSHDFVTPCAVVHVEAGKDTDEHPSDIVAEQRFTLSVFAENATGQAGGSALVGANRADLGSSRGRGVLEIEPLVKGQIFAQLGLTARPRSISGQASRAASNHDRTIAERAIELVATMIPSYPDYAPFRQLKGSGSGGATSFTFAAPPSRYDLIGFTWRRVSGSTPPSTPTGGTAGGFVATMGATTFNDTPGAGTWSYAFFWAYDQTRDPWTQTGTAAPNAWSSSQTTQNGVLYLPETATVSA